MVCAQAGFFFLCVRAFTGVGVLGAGIDRASHIFSCAPEQAGRLGARLSGDAALVRASMGDAVGGSMRGLARCSSPVVYTLCRRAVECSL
jgi:hypothetical protein